MDSLQELTNKAVEVATAASTHYPSSFLTTRFLKTLNITKDGPVSFGHSSILVPVNVFSFTTFKDHNVRVVLDRNNLSIIRILK